LTLILYWILTLMYYSSVTLHVISLTNEKKIKKIMTTF